MSADLLQFDKLMEEALVQGVVRKALEVFAQRGIVGQHHFYVTFRTADLAVTIPEHLRARYTPEMTIVLQHQFWGLEVDESGFAVTLSFDGKHERLKVPWHAIVAFVDPSVQFGLQFTRGSEAAPAAGPAKMPTPKPMAKPAVVEAKAPLAEANPAEAKPKAEGDGRVVTLDAFRKK